MKYNLERDQYYSPLPSKLKINQTDNEKRVIIIAGPTASGKTRLSQELAKNINGEIISADSIQVYKNMDIGTAKATLDSRSNIPHHLIDICDISHGYNVKEFYDQAKKKIAEIHKRKNVPIVVGGTGFYIQSLLNGPPNGPPASEKIRKSLSKDIENFGVEAMYQKLCSLDPKYGETINFRDRHKIIRAMEIMTISGKKVSSFKNTFSTPNSSDIDFRCWFIYFPREILFSRIEMRCDEMISQGFIKEVEDLLKSGIKENLSASQSIGYRQCIDFLESERTDEDWEKFVWEFKKASRRYAKRQFTWFKKDPKFRWVDLDIYGYQKTVEMVIQDYESRY